MWVLYKVTGCHCMNVYDISRCAATHIMVKSDVNRFGVGFVDVSHVGPRLAGLEGSMASIGLGQWQLSFT